MICQESILLPTSAELVLEEGHMTQMACSPSYSCGSKSSQSSVSGTCFPYFGIFSYFSMLTEDRRRSHFDSIHQFQPNNCFVVLYPFIVFNSLSKLNFFEVPTSLNYLNLIPTAVYLYSIPIGDESLKEASSTPSSHQCFHNFEMNSQIHSKIAKRMHS